MAKIYALVCKSTGFAYIGVTSAKLSKRFREHRCLCRSGKHHAPKLVEDWQRYGEADFSMQMLEETEYPKRGAHNEAEQRWISHYRDLGLLYNAHDRSAGLGGEATRKGVEAARHVVGNRWSAEANEKRRLAQLGKPKGHGAKISATKRAKRQQVMM
jgi:group I intron endonuclease